MSAQQIDYFRKVLADIPEVRWTFVLLYQPERQEENRVTLARRLNTCSREGPIR